MIFLQTLFFLKIVFVAVKRIKKSKRSHFSIHWKSYVDYTRLIVFFKYTNKLPKRKRLKKGPFFNTTVSNKFNYIVRNMTLLL